jgi:hypothetical protein
MYFIWFLISLLKLSKNEILNKSCDPTIPFCYGDKNDNFIRNFLKNLSEEEKKK